MPEVTIVYWRDIPAQVIVGKGRRGSKRPLPERFEQAIDRAAMKITLDVGVQKPEHVDRDALRAVFPYGDVTVNVVPGGLDIERPDGDGPPTIMANAALSIAFDMERGND